MAAAALVDLSADDLQMIASGVIYLLVVVIAFKAVRSAFF